MQREVTQPSFPAGNYMLKVNNRKTLEQGVKYVQSCSSVFTVNFKYISHLVLVFLWLTLSK